jgi:hypothetical protein
MATSGATITMSMREADRRQIIQAVVLIGASLAASDLCVPMEGRLQQDQ